MPRRKPRPGSTTTVHLNDDGTIELEVEVDPEIEAEYREYLRSVGREPFSFPSPTDEVDDGVCED